MTLLRAVADGREDAWSPSQALAERVLASPEARLAASVAHGGALAVTRAIELAERIVACPEITPALRKEGGRE